MPPKPTDGEDHTVADQFLKKHRWKPGRGRDRGSWFFPSEEFPRITLFWTSNGKPCMTYNEESTGRGVLMVSNGKKMENYSYGIEQMSKANPQGGLEGADGEVEDDDHLMRTVYKTFVAMRNW